MIKNYNQMQDLNQEQRKWDQLSQKLLKISQNINDDLIQKRKPSSKVNLIEGYTLVYSNCIQKPSKAEKMFTIFKQLLLNHLMLSTRLLQDREGNKIREFNEICLSYFTYAAILCKKVFSYLDRYYLPSKDVGSLTEVALGLFNQKIIVSTHSKHVLLQYFVYTFGEYRRNLIITDNELLRFAENLGKLNLQFYIELKRIFVQQSVKFYKLKFTESKELLPLQYYCKMHNLSIFQEVLVTKCFIWTPQIYDQRRELQTLFTKELIQPYTDTFLVHPQGFLWAFQFKKFNLLNQVIEIYTRYEGLSKIKEKYYQFVNNESRELINKLEIAPKTQSQIANQIYEFLTKHNTILIQGFKKNQQMQVTLSNAIESVLGKWQKYAQNLFLYCKSVVSRGDFKAKSYLIKQIFQKMGNKDEFIHKCEIWLEDIIFNEKVNLNVYKQFMSFLHELCGAENTLKLQKILSDYTQENQTKYSSFINSKILSFHLWQKRFKDQLAIDLNIPNPFAQLWKLLQQNYIITNSKKRLTLLPLSSNVLLVFKNKGISFSVKCNLLQSSIIMALSFKRKTLDELQQELNIEKHRIEGFIQLTKFIKQRSQFYCLEWQENMTEDCDFTIQSENTSKFNKAIEQDRTILLEANIVRIVKRKKEVSFEEIFSLLSQCIKLFKPLPAMVKTTIEKLIKRDFVEQNEQGLYLYKE